MLNDLNVGRLSPATHTHPIAPIIACDQKAAPVQNICGSPLICDSLYSTAPCVYGPREPGHQDAYAANGAYHLWVAARMVYGRRGSGRAIEDDPRPLGLFGVFERPAQKIITGLVNCYLESYSGFFASPMTAPGQNGSM